VLFDLLVGATPLTGLLEMPGVLNDGVPVPVVVCEGVLVAGAGAAEAGLTTWNEATFGSPDCEVPSALVARTE